MALFKHDTRILFVCTENICRSPLAEGLLRHHLQLTGRARGVKVSSAGTLASHPGAKPDQRAQKVAAAAGINLGKIRASRVSEEELVRSDFVFAMDRKHLAELLEICPPQHRHKVSLLLTCLPEQALDEVPDPYYGTYQGFVEVFQLIENAVLGLVNRRVICD